MIAAIFIAWWHALLVFLAGAATLAVRFFAKRDANEKQRAVDQARQDAVIGDDAALNADLAAARDRLQNKSGSGQ